MTHRMHANLIKALVVLLIFIVLAVKSMIGEAQGYNDVPHGKSDLTGELHDMNVFLK